MIKALTATTRNIDDVQAAVNEVLTSLNLEINLLKNSLGIVSCFSEFEETGALKAICEAMPFDCIGSTTCLCAAGREVDEVIFAIIVLTSDDCEFKSLAVTITEQYEQSIQSSMADLLEQPAEKPALLLSYFPLMNTVNISGDMMLSAIDSATGGIPLFGLTTSDHTMDYSTAKTIRNGDAFSDAIVLGAIFGSPKVTFEVASLNENKFRKQKAVITESDGNILIGVNGKNAMEYLGEIGFTKEQISTGLGVIPLVVDYMDGRKPVVRAVFTLTPEGYVVCGGEMPVNATLGIGHVDMNDVLETTNTALRTLVDKDSVILCYSCIARHLVLGMNNTVEAEKVVELTGGARYLFAYTGGEICPLPDANGELKNVYHNFTVVFCRLS